MTPIIDLTALCAILSNFNPAWAHSAEDPSTSTATLLAYYGLFQVVDLAGAALAIHLDRKRGTWRLLPLMVVQRFCYRQLLSLVVLRAFVAICQGRVVGWASVARTGSLCGPEARARIGAPRELVPAREYSDSRERNSASGRAIAGLAGLSWAKSVSVGVPALVVASCAIVLLRVPEVTNMLSLTSPRIQPVVVAAVDLAKSGPAPVAPSVPPGIEVKSYGTNGAPDRPTLSAEEQPRRSVALRSPATVELAQVPQLVPTTGNKLSPLDEVKTTGQRTVAAVTSPELGAKIAVVAQEAKGDEIKTNVETNDNDIAVVAGSEEPSSGLSDVEFGREGAPVIDAAEITGSQPQPLTRIADLPEVTSRPATSAEEERGTVRAMSVRRKQSSRRKAVTAKRRGRPNAQTADAAMQFDSDPEFDSFDRPRRRHHLSAMR
jgi:hypothetical protein